MAPPNLPDLPLPGAHQRRNAGLALAMAEALGVPGEAAALADVRWPGRGERLDDVLLDCAHNPDAAAALMAWLPEPRHLLFGAGEGKDVPGMAAALGPHAASVTLVTPRYPRCLPAAQLADAFAPYGPRIIDGVGAALDARPGPTLVCGSCFLVGEARAHLLGLPFPERGIVTTAR